MSSVGANSLHLRLFFFTRSPLSLHILSLDTVPSFGLIGIALSVETGRDAAGVLLPYWQPYNDLLAATGDARCRPWHRFDSYDRSITTERALTATMCPFLFLTIPCNIMRYVVDEYGEGIKTRFSSPSDVIDFLNNRLDIAATDVVVLHEHENKILTRKTAHEFIELQAQ